MGHMSLRHLVFYGSMRGPKAREMGLAEAFGAVPQEGEERQGPGLGSWRIC